MIIGRFPYWEWGLDAGNMDKSPVFDGSETSMGGNGEYIAGHHATVGFGVKPGTGGGCVTKGPFANYTVNLGPSSLSDPLNYNPRCLKRDLNTAVCAQWASLRNTTDTILNSPDIEIFQAILQGDGRYPESLDLGMAVHGGGHYAISEYP
jgi:tyrosinase